MHPSKALRWTVARAAFLSALIFGLGAACGPSPRRVCERTCQTNFTCRLNGVTSDNALELCLAHCFPAAVELEQQVEDGRLTEDCFDARLDYEDCLNGLECSDLRRERFGRCAELADRQREACEAAGGDQPDDD